MFSEKSLGGCYVFTFGVLGLVFSVISYLSLVRFTDGTREKTEGG